MRLLAILILATASLSAQSPAFLADSNTDILHSVDITTGAATTIGSTLPMATPCGLAHDGTNLFALDLGGSGELYTLDPATGTPTLVGATGLTGWQDLAWDATTGQFFAVNQNDTLYTIDTTGVATLVGTTTPTSHLFTSIAIDATGTLWALDFLGSGELGTLDKTTGAFTSLFSSLSGVQGLGFDPATGVLYASSTGTDSLYTIDTTTGASTLVGAHGNGVIFGKGFCFAGQGCVTPTYQVNSAAASLTLDNSFTDGCTPTVVTVTPNPTGPLVTVSLLSNVHFAPATGWEAIIDNSPVVPLGGGALTTGGGQIVNVNFASPGLSFFFGGALPVFAGINPASGFQQLSFAAPTGPLTLTMQAAFLNPASLDGLSLTQAAQLEVL